MRGRGWASSAIFLALVATTACGARRPTLPDGPGAPFPGFDKAYADASADCRGVKSLTASLGLSGRTNGQSLRGRVDVGLMAPARARLEGFPPVLYGSRPFFVLVAEGERATLHLPRDERVLRDAPPEAIVDALAGVALGPDDLRHILSGCGFGDAPGGDARLFDNGWAAAPQGQGMVYLRPGQNGWLIAAATRDRMEIHYDDYAGRRPQRVRIRTESNGRTGADITLRLSDVEWNIDLEDRVFDIQIPPAAAPMTLDELRAAGPLRAGGA